MRIALTCNFSPWSAYVGGGQRSTHALATALVRRGHDVTVVYTACPWARPTPSQAPAYRVRWANFVGLRAQRTSPLRPLNAFSVAQVIAALHREQPLHVVHAQGEEAALVPRWAQRAGVRFVFTPRYPHYPAYLRPEMSRVAKARAWLRAPKLQLVGQLLRTADRVTATSTSAALALQSAFDLPLSRTVVIPNGVDPAFFERSWRGPQPDAPLLFFGRLEADKGVDTLLQAMARCERPLRVVGRGVAEARYRELAQRLGVADRVRFEGWQSASALAAWLEQSALAVLPSLNESFGNAMVEAMAAGVPLITTRAGSIPEVVGDAAVLVPPADAEALGAAIAALLREPGRAIALGQAGRVYVRQRYGWDRVASQYEELYSEPSATSTGAQPQDP